MTWLRSLLAVVITAVLAVATEAHGQWEAQWEKTVAAAKKEGELSIYLNAPAQVRPALTKAFEEKFGIRSYVVTGTGPELSAKIVTEYSAGLHQADVSFQGCSTLIALVGIHGYLALGSKARTAAWAKSARRWARAKTRPRCA